MEAAENITAGQVGVPPVGPDRAAKPAADKKSTILNWLIVFVTVTLIVVLFTIAVLALRAPETVSVDEGDAFSTPELIEELVKKFEQTAPSSQYSLGDLGAEVTTLISQSKTSYIFSPNGEQEVRTGNLDDGFVSSLLAGIEYKVIGEVEEDGFVKVSASGTASDFEGFYVFEVDDLTGQVLAVSLSVVYTDAVGSPVSGTFNFTYELPVDGEVLGVTDRKSV